MREAERQKEEAIAYAQKLQNQAEKVRGQYDAVGNNYTKELEAKVQTGMDAAQLAYKQAVESQNVDGQVEAQKAIAQMAMEEVRLKQIKKAQEQREVQIEQQKTAAPTQPQAQPDQFAQAAQQIDPKAETWASFNILISPPSISIRDPAYLANITQSFSLHHGPLGYLSWSL